MSHRRFLHSVTMLQSLSFLIILFLPIVAATFL